MVGVSLTWFCRLSSWSGVKILQCSGRLNVHWPRHLNDWSHEPSFRLLNDHASFSSTITISTHSTLQLTLSIRRHYILMCVGHSALPSVGDRIGGQRPGHPASEVTVATMMHRDVRTDPGSSNSLSRPGPYYRYSASLICNNPSKAPRVSNHKCTNVGKSF